MLRFHPQKNTEPFQRLTGEVNVTEPTCFTKVTEISGGMETAREELFRTR